jgi:adenine-specific DNA-methyltransferase
MSEELTELPALNRFIGLLKTIFEIDKADLDFGIYRIMNIRKTEAERFFWGDAAAKHKGYTFPGRGNV